MVTTLDFHAGDPGLFPQCCHDSMVYWLARPLGKRTIPGLPPLVSNNSFVEKKLASDRKNLHLEVSRKFKFLLYQTKASKRTELMFLAN